MKFPIWGCPTLPALFVSCAKDGHDAAWRVRFDSAEIVWDKQHRTLPFGITSGQALATAQKRRSHSSEWKRKNRRFPEKFGQRPCWALALKLLSATLVPPANT